MKANKTNYHLLLQHKAITSHKEYWLVTNNCISVLAVTPQNWPQRSEHFLTRYEALKNYALMVSRTEGWKVITEKEEWRNFLQDENTGLFTWDDMFNIWENRMLQLTENNAEQIQEEFDNYMEDTNQHG